jgi:predicted aspartyl protease
MAESNQRTPSKVGITFARAQLTNPRRPDIAAREMELLVDSGAILSVVPASVLGELGVVRERGQDFTLADGSHVTYDIGEVNFAVGDRSATSKVVFAPEGVTPLLGAVTLEGLMLMLNPVTRELLPMRLFLARAGWLMSFLDTRDLPVKEPLAGWHEAVTAGHAIVVDHPRRVAIGGVTTD